MSDREEYVRGLLGKHREALHKAETAEARYVQVVGRHRQMHPHDPTTADFLAADDPELRTAVADGSFHRDRAQMYALAYLAERDYDDRRVRPWPTD